MSDGEDFLTEEFVAHENESYNLGLEDEDELLADDAIHDFHDHLEPEAIHGHIESMGDAAALVSDSVDPMFEPSDITNEDEFSIDKDVEESAAINADSISHTKVYNNNREPTVFVPIRYRGRGRGNMRNMHRPEHFNNRFPFDGLRHPNRFPRGFHRGRFFRGKMPGQFQDRHGNPDEMDEDFIPHEHGRFGPEGPRNFNPNGHYGSEGPPRNFNPNGHYGSERPPRNFNPNERPEHFGANRFQRGFRFNPPSRIIRSGGPPRDVRPPNFREYRPNAPSQGPRSVGPHSMQPPFNNNQPPIRQGPPPRHTGPPGERGIAPSQFGQPPQNPQFGPPPQNPQFGPPLQNSQFRPPIGPLLTHTIGQPAQMGLPMGPPVQMRPPMGPPPAIPQPEPIHPAMLAVRPPPVAFNPVPGYVQPQLQPAHLQITRPTMPQSLGPLPRPVGPTILQTFVQPAHSLHPNPSGNLVIGNENSAPRKLNPDPVLAAQSKSDVGLSDEKMLGPPGVSPDQADVMRSPESITSPLKKSSDVPKGDFVNATGLEKGLTTILPIQSQINNFEMKPEGKKVLINPHFRGSVQPPAVGVNYLPGPEPYQATPPVQSGSISETEFNRLTDQFINEQRRCLDKVKNQGDEDFFQKTQRFIDNLSKESSKDSERDRYRERERDRDRTNRSKLERLQRAQEKFIQENKAQLSSLKRRRDSPNRGVSPKRQRTPEEQVDPEEREYRNRLREQAEMRQRVLLVKERRRKRDAASKLLTQPETGFDHGDNQAKQYSEKDMSKSSSNANPPHQAVESKPMDSSSVKRGVESGQHRDMYAREDDKQSRYRSERREDDYYGGRSDTYRQDDAKTFRQDSHLYKNTEQIPYKPSASQDFGDSLKTKSHRDEKRDTYDNYDANYYRVDERTYEAEGKAGYRVDERRDGTRMETSYRDDNRTNYRMDDRRDIPGYNQDERREVLNYRNDDRRDLQNYKQDDRRDPQSYRQDERRDFQGYKQDDRRDPQGYKQDERRDPQSYKQDDRRDPQSYKQDDRRDPQSYKQDDRRDPQSYKQDDRRDLQSYKQDDRRDILEYRQEEKYDERSYRLEGGTDMSHYEKSANYSYKPEDRNYYRTENRKDVQRPIERRDANDYRTEEGRDSSYYRVDDRRDTLKSKSDDRKDIPGYRPEERKDVINYRTDEKKKSPGSRNDNYSFKTIERSDHYIDDRAYRNDDKYRQDEKFDQQGSYKIDDKKDRREYQNYERRDRFDEKRVHDERKTISKTEDKKVSEVKSASEEVRKIDRKTPEKCPPKNSKVSQKTADNKVIGIAADIKTASVKSTNEKSNADKAKYEEDLLLQDYEPTLDEMLEDDTLRLNPEDEDLLLSDNESHTPPPVSRPKANPPAKHPSDESVPNPKDGNIRSDTRSLTPPRPASRIKRSLPTDGKSSADLRTKLARNTPPTAEVQQPSGKQPSMISKEKKKIVYDIRDTKGDLGAKGQWMSTFTEQKLEKSAPIAARAISAALGRDSAPKRTVVASSQQNIESSSDALNKRNTNTATNSGRRVLVGKTDTTGGPQSNRTVVLPKRQPVVIVEKDDDHESDEPKAKKGKDQKVATAFISGLPPGMTEIRLLSLCGPEVEQVTLSTTERDSATARFLSADACDRFIRRFDGRIVAACSLRVRKST